LRVALVIDRFDPGRGGGEGYAVSLAQGLAARGHEVHIFAQSWEEPSGGLRYHGLPRISYPRWAKAMMLAVTAQRRVGRQGFHVVHGFGGVPGVDVHRPGGGAELAWLAQEIRSRERGWDRAATAFRRTLSMKLAINLLVEGRLYRPTSPTWVVANSAKVRSDILRCHRSMDPGRIRLIPNGVDLRRYHPENRERLGKEVRRRLGLSEETTVLLFMAHNFRLKGLHCLMRALGGLEDRRGTPPWVLLVAGRGRRGPFEVLAQRCGIGERTLFLGPMREPEAVLGASDVLVHPTFYDPFSNVCLEAMASGLPVVTSSQNGAGEIIREGESGFVISDPNRTDLLRERIMTLMDRRRREAMGQLARGIAGEFSWEKHISQMEEMYGLVRESKEKALQER
jgi:UDP-glucose:(heptosyl)LPS alpha-1,3-glucosyltransferase